ncbi:uncharacterized protein LOC100867997 [Apis florea]|uniref:uncharacterized protein LOC100867997 n=1 Tax=Apis florea TaxID=7463 RepID=UPI000252AF1F|nr:uncharacterized protein LOC100867997 [Apis florea]
MLLVSRILRSFVAMAIIRGTLTFDSLDRLLEDAIPVLFPPVRMSLHLCRLEQEDAIKLSKRMSSKRFIHEIRREFDGFAARTHDNWEHRDLYVLDLNCDYAIPLLRTANETGMFSAPMKWLLLRDRSSVVGDSRDERETLKDMAVYPDSEVIVARKRMDGVVEISSVYRPSPFHEAIEEDRGNWTIEHGVRMPNLYPSSRRRRDLRRTPLKSCLVMTDPDTINHLTDYENKHIDPVTKANYPWIMHIANRMNAT